jgi:hypothetical protein
VTQTSFLNVHPCPSPADACRGHGQGRDQPGSLACQRGDDQSQRREHPALRTVDRHGDRAGALVCVADDEGLRFDIRLQGDRETVFLTTAGD